ncbi:hypothetical protein MTBLM5_520017 [Magnetospirillum sp. LM-5]|nr:hypothetical protein MTBLM5_520017 [Magnetospirillum sp. LM-5]
MTRERKAGYGHPVDAFSINPAEIRHFSQFYEPYSVPGRCPAVAVPAFLQLCEMRPSGNLTKCRSARNCG